VDHIGAQLWHAATVPNALIGVLAVAVAVGLRWYWRRSAAGRQQAQVDDERTSPHAPSESNPHPESLARAVSAEEPCGTIKAVTPMPAPLSSPGAGFPHAAGAGVPHDAPGDVPTESGALRTSDPDPVDRTPDPVLAAAVDIARAAAQEEAEPGDNPIGSPVLTLAADGADAVGEHVAVEAEVEGAATHYFESHYPGYVGWRWAVTVANAGPGEPVTVSEVVLLPGPEALTAPDWVPWSDRVQPGDLGAGDLLPSHPDDPRLAPGYLASDDPAVEEVALDVGLGRVRVPSREGREEAAERWYAGDFGPHSEIAKMAPATCGTCGYFLPLAGSMRAAFGVCSNEVAPADGRVVHVEFGCGAHSEAEVDTSSTVPVADVVYDDATLDYEPRDNADRETSDPASGSTE
jgi:hypothetical protein